jgi:hypothetical protein
VLICGRVSCRESRRKLTSAVWKNTVKKEMWLRYHLSYAKRGFTNQYVIDPQRGMIDRKDIPLEVDKARNLDSDADSGEDSDESDYNEMRDDRPYSTVHSSVQQVSRGVLG